MVQKFKPRTKEEYEKEERNKVIDFIIFLMEKYDISDIDLYGQWSDINGKVRQPYKK